MKRPHNPAAQWLAITTVTTLGIVSLSLLFGFEALFDSAAKPLILICAILLLVYTALAIHLGWIATIGHLGKVYHYERKKEAVLFWMLVILYLGLAGPTAWYMAALLLGRG